jgi:hypothetical protein
MGCRACVSRVGDPSTGLWDTRVQVGQAFRTLGFRWGGSTAPRFSNNTSGRPRGLW